MHFRNKKKAPKVFKEKDIAKTLPELIKFKWHRIFQCVLHCIHCYSLRNDLLHSEVKLDQRPILQTLLFPLILVLLDNMQNTQLNLTIT